MHFTAAIWTNAGEEKADKQRGKTRSPDMYVQASTHTYTCNKLSPPPAKVIHAWHCVCIARDIVMAGAITIISFGLKMSMRVSICGDFFWSTFSAVQTVFCWPWMCVWHGDSAPFTFSRPRPPHSGLSFLGSHFIAQLATGRSGGRAIEPRAWSASITRLPPRPSSIDCP